VFELAQASIVGVVGFSLLAPGSDGVSAFQHIMSTLQNGIKVNVGVNGLPIGGGDSTPTSPGVSPGPTPADSGASSFTFNDPQNWAAFSEGAGRMTAHAAIGHIGNPGTYVCGMDVRARGGIFGLGGGAWAQAQQIQFAVGQDGAYSGYGVDFDVVLGRELLQNSPRLLSSVGVRFWISDTNGVSYDRSNELNAQIGV
jgi:hypothetical protein